MQRMTATILALCLGLLGSTASSLVAAEDQSLQISDVWSRAMPPGVPTGAVYFTLDNPTADTLRLIGAETPIAAKAELHQHLHSDGMMRMQQIDQVEIPAHGSLTFRPGGFHVMLFGLKQSLNAGEGFPLTLHFEQAPDRTLEVSIRSEAPAQSRQAPAQGHHH